MPLASTVARVTRAHGTGLYLVVALANDPVREGGVIASVTHHEDILHDDRKPLEHGDVCHRQAEGRLIRCGHI